MTADGPTKPESERYTFIGFKADAQTVDAIKKLTAAAAKPGVAAPRSVAIRAALIDAARRLSKK